VTRKQSFWNVIVHRPVCPGFWRRSLRRALHGRGGSGLLRLVHGHQPIAVLPDHLGVAIDAVALVAGHCVPITGRGQLGQLVEALLVMPVRVRRNIRLVRHDAARCGGIEFGRLARPAAACRPVGAALPRLRSAIAAPRQLGDQARRLQVRKFGIMLGSCCKGLRLAANRRGGRGGGRWRRLSFRRGFPRRGLRLRGLRGRGRGRQRGLGLRLGCRLGVAGAVSVAAAGVASTSSMAETRMVFHLISNPPSRDA
jgi:hypothetical protein